MRDAFDKISIFAVVMMATFMLPQQHGFAGTSGAGDNVGHMAYNAQVFATLSTANANPEAIAKEFVDSSQLYKGLSLLLLDSVKETTMVRQAIQDSGFQNVQATVVESIREVTEAYRSQWTGYLADFYSHEYSPKMLISILKRRENSPYFRTFVSQQAQLHKTGTHLESRLFHKARADLAQKLHEKFKSL